MSGCHWAFVTETYMYDEQVPCLFPITNYVVDCNDFNSATLALATPSQSGVATMLKHFGGYILGQ